MSVGSYVRAGITRSRFSRGHYIRRQFMVHDARPQLDAPAGSRPSPVRRRVGALLAPVVACLRGDDDGVRALFDGACEDGTIDRRAAGRPAVVARVYLRLAPPPDGADRILSGYVGGALDRFGDREVVAIGAECLEVARADSAIAPIAEAVFVDAALEHGRWNALVGAVASCWWCAERGARAARHRPRRGDRRDLPLPRVGRGLTRSRGSSDDSADLERPVSWTSGSCSGTCRSRRPARRPSPSCPRGRRRRTSRRPR